MSLATYQFPQVGDFVPESVMFGQSDAMLTLRRDLDKIASTDLPVLIQGETGAGKQFMARIIHRRSPWSRGPFIRIGCANSLGTSPESALFGYEKDNCAAASHNWSKGVPQGTLYLDEISELDPALQSSLLQLLEDGQLCPILGKGQKKVEFRLICTTTHRLETKIESDAFCRQLFSRINLLKVRLPALRERRDDIEGLTQYFLNYYNRKYGCHTKPLPRSLVADLQNHRWPGNIAELEGLIKRYVILGSENIIATHLAADERRDFLRPEINFDASISLKDLTRQVTRELERKVILKALQENRWNRKLAARALCISYRGLLYKINQAGLCPTRSTPAIDE
jgi:two-component system response regulator AtoC